MEITVTKNYFPYTVADGACTAGVAKGPKRLYDDGPKSVAISVPVHIRIIIMVIVYYTLVFDQLSPPVRLYFHCEENNNNNSNNMIMDTRATHSESSRTLPVNPSSPLSRLSPTALHRHRVSIYTYGGGVRCFNNRLLVSDGKCCC